MKRAVFFFSLFASAGCGAASTCPATEPPSSSVRSVKELVEAAKTDATLEGRDVTVCGFLWHEYEEDSLWHDDEAFERGRACIAGPAVCVQRKNEVRLSLTGNREKWRGFKGDRACVSGTFHVARAITNSAVSPVEIAVRCVRK